MAQSNPARAPKYRLGHPRYQLVCPGPIVLDENDDPQSYPYESIQFRNAKDEDKRLVLARTYGDPNAPELQAYMKWLNPLSDYGIEPGPINEKFASEIVPNILPCIEILKDKPREGEWTLIFPCTTLITLQDLIDQAISRTTYLPENFIKWLFLEYTGALLWLHERGVEYDNAKLSTDSFALQIRLPNDADYWTNGTLPGLQLMNFSGSKSYASFEHVDIPDETESTESEDGEGNPYDKRAKREALKEKRKKKKQKKERKAFVRGDFFGMPRRNHLDAVASDFWHLYNQFLQDDTSPDERHDPPHPPDSSMLRFIRNCGNGEEYNFVRYQSSKWHYQDTNPRDTKDTFANVPIPVKIQEASRIPDEDEKLDMLAANGVPDDDLLRLYRDELRIHLKQMPVKLDFPSWIRKYFRWITDIYDTTLHQLKGIYLDETKDFYDLDRGLQQHLKESCTNRHFPIPILPAPSISVEEGPEWQEEEAMHEPQESDSDKTFIRCLEWTFGVAPHEGWSADWGHNEWWEQERAFHYFHHKLRQTVERCSVEGGTREQKEMALSFLSLQLALSRRQKEHVLEEVKEQGAKLFPMFQSAGYADTQAYLNERLT